MTSLTGRVDSASRPTTHLPSSATTRSRSWSLTANTTRHDPVSMTPIMPTTLPTTTGTVTQPRSHKPPPRPAVQAATFEARRPENKRQIV